MSLHRARRSTSPAVPRSSTLKAQSLSGGSQLSGSSGGSTVLPLRLAQPLSLQDISREPTGKWVEVMAKGDAPLPRGRFGLAYHQERNSVLLYGGTSNEVVFQDLHEFSLQDASWTLLECPGPVHPGPRYGHTATMLNGRFYVLGGRTDTEVLSDAFALNLDTMQWSALPSLDSEGGPGAVWGHACVAADDKIFVMAGTQGKDLTSGPFLGQLHQLELCGEAATWSVVPAKSLNGVPPMSRAFHSLSLCGNRLVMYGGLGEEGALSDLQIFNLDSCTWLRPSLNKLGEADQPSPGAAHSHAAVALDDNSVLLLGGEAGEDDLLDNTHIYQIKSRNWYRLPMLAAASNEPLGALSQHSCVHLDGKLWVFAGLRPQYVKKRRQFVAAHQYVNSVVVVSHVEGPRQSVCTPHARNRKQISHLEQQVGAWRESSKDLEAEKKRRERKEKSGKDKQDKADRRGREKQERAERRIKKKFTASSPMKVVHKMHIDKDFNWAGDPDQCFALMDKLGEGAFGAVYRGVMRSTGSVMAIKVIRDLTSEDELASEIEILKRCQNRNVVGYYGTVSKTPGEELWILMELCKIGSVRDIIETCEQVITEKQAAYILFHSILGLIYLHNNHIIHRDIKAANILISDDMCVKMADFGVSEQLTSAVAKADETVGTPMWMAPEVILQQDYDGRADVWSLGITAIEMVEGLPPRHADHPMLAIRMIPRDPPPVLKEPENFSTEFKDFIAQCLTKDHEKRPTAAELLAHPFLQQEDVNDSTVMEPVITRLNEIRMERARAQTKILDELQVRNRRAMLPGGGMESEAESTSGISSSGAESSDNTDPSMGTMVIRTESEDANSFGTMVISHEPSSPDSFGTMVIRKEPGSSPAPAHMDFGATTVFHQPSCNPANKAPSSPEALSFGATAVFRSDPSLPSTNQFGTMLFAKGNDELPSPPASAQSATSSSGPSGIERAAAMMASSTAQDAVLDDVREARQKNTALHTQLESEVQALFRDEALSSEERQRQVLESIQKMIQGIDLQLETICLRHAPIVDF